MSLPTRLLMVENNANEGIWVFLKVSLDRVHYTAPPGINLHENLIIVKCLQ